VRPPRWYQSRRVRCAHDARGRGSPLCTCPMVGAALCSTGARCRRRSTSSPALGGPTAWATPSPWPAWTTPPPSALAPDGSPRCSASPSGRRAPRTAAVTWGARCGRQSVTATGAEGRLGRRGARAGPEQAPPRRCLRRWGRKAGVGDVPLRGRGRGHGRGLGRGRECGKERGGGTTGVWKVWTPSL
jgi:hypothetical protein